MAEASNHLIPGPEGRLSIRTKGLESKPDQVVIMVQGTNLSGQTGYDFQYGEGVTYSLLDAMVARGIGAVTFALSGYELSDPPADPLAVDTEHAIGDFTAVMDWLATQGYAAPAVLGWSWGGRISGHYASRHPEQVNRLVLLDPALGGGNLIVPGPTEAWWVNTREDYMKRLEPDYIEPAAHKAFIDHMLVHDVRAPNGIRVENAIGSVPVDPTVIQCPTLMIYGSAAARQAYMQGGVVRADFFEKLPTKDKRFFIIPDGGDYGHLQNPRGQFHKAIADFLLDT